MNHKYELGKTLMGAVLFGGIGLLSACSGSSSSPAPVPEPTPTPTPVPVPRTSVTLAKTGQTTCFSDSGTIIACTGTGQDGDLQIGVAEPSQRFTVDGSGNCITDSLTGLMWSRNANLAVVAKTWQQSLDYVNNLALCGYSDWRLPNSNELRSLVNYNTGHNDTALIAQGFSDVKSSYWSSTSTSVYPNSALTVQILEGGMRGSLKNANGSIWPVRAVQ